MTEEKRQEGRWESALDVGGDGTLQGAATRTKGEEEGRGITVFRIPVYERQPRRPFETRATATLVARCGRGRSRSKRTRRSERGRDDGGERTEANALIR